MKNYFQLELGTDAEGNPVKRGVKLNNRTIDIIAEITGKDPLTEFNLENTEWKNLEAFCSVIIKAGLRSNCVTKKVDPDFTDEQVTEWIKDLSPGDLYNIVAAYGQFLNPNIQLEKMLSGEESTNTQQQTADVAAP